MTQDYSDRLWVVAHAADAVRGRARRRSTSRPPRLTNYVAARPPNGRGQRLDAQRRARDPLDELRPRVASPRHEQLALDVLTRAWPTRHQPPRSASILRVSCAEKSRPSKYFW